MLLSCVQAKWATKIAYVSAALIGAASVALADPLSSNNGMYPDPEYARVLNPNISQYGGPFNISNLNYPTEEITTPHWKEGTGLEGRLTHKNAAAYMAALKDHIAPSMSTLVDRAHEWDAVKEGWYNMVWRGAGSPTDPSSGREAIMNTHTGQIVPSISWSEEYRPRPEFMQNYGVIYYNPRAAYMLGQVWENPYDPDLDSQNFPDGSIVVKVEAATVQPEDWPWAETGGSVLDGAAQWQVFRPTTADQKIRQRDPSFELTNKVQTVYPFQLAIKVKDPEAAPDTGWVFLGYVFDARAPGATAWEKFVPAGLMWGNDPNYATAPDGRPPEGEELQETWVNPAAPDFVTDTLGWGGRMAAPMDVAVRHNVLLPSGERPDEALRASSCLSCHGAAQHPFAANIYPSPNLSFPPDGERAFLLYEPGSPQWAEWFQNRPGDEAQSGEHIHALDYDLSTMMALLAKGASGGTRRDERALETLNGH